MPSVVACLANYTPGNSFPTIPPLDTREFFVIMADQVAAEDVGNTELLNITISSSVGGLLLKWSIKLVVLEGMDELLMLGHPTMKAELGIDVKRILTNLQAEGETAEFDRPYPS